MYLKKRSLRILIILLFLFSPFLNSAQTQSGISGIVFDSETSDQLSFATVSVLNSSDNSLVTGTITDSQGAFKINVAPGIYIVRVQFVAYETVEISSVKVEAGTTNLGRIELTESTEQLSEVVVQAERTQMELNLDKKVYNVGKDLSNLGGSASNILENLPSVTVDVDGAVQLRGSSNVRILIDGKPSGLVGLSGTDALRQIQANLIESIEIITNPSARYDAEGQAGIINIVLKKEERKGVNGSFQANTGYPHNHGVSANVNFRREKINFFTNYGFDYNRTPGLSSTQLAFNNPDSSFFTNQKGKRSRGGYTNSIRTGMDFYINKKTTLTASFLYRHSDELNNQDLNFEDLNSDRIPFNYILREDEEHEIDENLEYALNFSRSFDKKGQKFTFDLQYQNNEELEESDIVESQGESKSLLAPSILQRNRNEEGERRLMIQADYFHPFNEKGVFEIGYRSTFRDIKNKYLVEQADDNGFYMALDTFSTDFDYQENVHAGYVILSNNYDKFSWQMGLRTEVSDILANRKKEGIKRTYNYINFFPSAFLTYKVKNSSQLQLSYSRRINRPRFRELNPLSSFTNNRSFRVGNTNLQPEYTDSYEFGYLQNFEAATIYYGIYYRYTTQLIQRVSPPANSDGITFSIPENLGNSKSFGIELNTAKDFTEWYRINGNFNFYRQEINGVAFGENLAAETITYSLRLSNNFKVSDLFNAQLNVSYRAPQNRSQGRSKSVTSVDFGITRDFWNENGTLALSVRDVFNSRKYRYATETSNFVSNRVYQSRVGPLANLSLTYRLNQKKERSSRKSSEEDFNGDGGF